MASSGSFNTSGYNGRYLEFAWTIKSQSIANNKTTISWTLTGRGTAPSGFYKSGKFKVVIDGTTVYSSETRINLYNGTQVASGEYTMTHDATGKKSFSASAQAGIYTVAVNCTGSGSWSLTDIPRQANITSAPNFTDIQNPTINYSNPAGNNVSSLQACISLTGSAADISYRDISKTGTSYTFNLTEAERNVLRQATPNSNTLSIKFYVKTVIGGNTFYSNVTKTMTIVNANPTVATLTYIDSNSTTTAVTQNNQLLVQNLSTPRFTISNVNALKYATVKKYDIKIGEVVLGSGTGSAAHYDTLTVNSQALNYSNNQTAVLTIEDSRGNKVTKNITLTIAEWKKPTAIINFSRLNNFYSDTELTVDASFSSVNEKNTITIYYSYKKKSASSYSAEQTMQDNTTVTLTLDNTFEWDLKVRLVDKFSTVTYNMTVAKGVPIIFFDKNLNATGFNGFPPNENSVWASNIPLDDLILIGSQQLYDYYTTTSQGTTNVLGAYSYNLVDGLFDGMTIPAGYEKAYKITAQITTVNNNNVSVSINNISTSAKRTWSSNTYRSLISSRIFKQSELTLEDVMNYETNSQKGLNLSVTNGAAYKCEVYAITLHGYLVKEDTDLDQLAINTMSSNISTASAQA